MLEYPRHDTFWFDPRLGFALRRRDSYNPESGTLKERIVLQDHVAIEGVWLPRILVREEFSNPLAGNDSEPRLLGTVTLEVQQFSTAAIPDSQFRMAAPIGVTVHDTKNRIFYTHYRAGENPILSSAEAARRALAPPNRYPRALVAIVALLSLVLLWFAFLALRARSRGRGRART